MTDKRKIQGDKKENKGDNLKNDEMGNISNEFLGQLGHEREGRTESFQGNWTGNYGNGFISISGDRSSSGDFVSQTSNIGNGLNSDEDDLLSSGQNVDDLGLGNSGGTTAGKEGETERSTSRKGTASENGNTNTSAEGSVMPDPEDTTAQNKAASEDNNQADDIEENDDEGPGLATSGDFASMTGQQIADLDLPSDADVAGWRQNAGTVGQGSGDQAGVDTGHENTARSNSGEFTTGKADTEGGWGQYPNSGDLGQVDPGQQNYVEDQDSTKAFTAGDYKTSQERDPEEGSEKYTREKTKNVRPGDVLSDDEEG